MKIELERTGLNRIRQYGPGGVTVNETVLRQSFLITPERLYLDWAATGVATLTEGHFQLIADLKPEVVLLGTGASLRFPTPVLTLPLMKARIGLEVMDTPAACRTYNILMGDGRRVLAALLMMESAAQLDSTE